MNETFVIGHSLFFHFCLQSLKSVTENKLKKKNLKIIFGILKRASGVKIMNS